jgi:hypothetical protein
MAGGGGGGGGGFSPAARGGNPGAFNGGNAGAFNGGRAFNGGNNMSFRGESRMGRMDHDRDHDGRFRGFRGFRGPSFAFGYPGYDYYASDYDDGCYQLREVPTRYGWRWLRVWVCD